MIKNERQYKITALQVRNLTKALDQFDAIERAREGIDPVIIAAQREALVQQISDLEAELSAYLSLKSGKVRRLFADNIETIGQNLVDARIAQGLSQKELGERLGMKEQQIQRYERERYLTANLTRVSEVADALELNLVAFFNARPRKKRDEGDLMGENVFDPSRLPVREMKKRGWLSHRQSPKARMTDVEAAAAFVSSSMPTTGVPSLLSQHVRARSHQDPYALLAWKARVLERARAKIRLERKSIAALDPNIVNCFAPLSADPQGPVKIIDNLLQHGILVVLEKHLPGTHLDGASMLLDNSVPIVGLTLRHDRLDNFWFVLAHEVAHVLLHRDKGLRETFFDDEESSTLDLVEKEADEFAKRTFIADEVWKRSFVRFTTAKSEIQTFAESRGVGAAVVAGRIRRDRNDYSVFGDLVGAGLVRKLMANSGYWES